MCHNYFKFIMHSYERVNTQKRLAIGRHTNEMETDKMAAQDGLYVFSITLFLLLLHPSLGEVLKTLLLS